MSIRSQRDVLDLFPRYGHFHILVHTNSNLRISTINKKCRNFRKGDWNKMKKVQTDSLATYPFPVVIRLPPIQHLPICYLVQQKLPTQEVAVATTFNAGTKTVTAHFPTTTAIQRRKRKINVTNFSTFSMRKDESVGRKLFQI